MFTELQHYAELVKKLNEQTDSERTQLVRHFARNDLFFLLWFLCGRDDMFHQWILDRCIEVQKSPNGHIDLWSRSHYKSTIITFGLILFDILRTYGVNAKPIYGDIEPTFGIFSVTRPLAKAFLRQLKLEFEKNEALKQLFPDIFWSNPKKEAPKWSEDDGLILKRKSNPKEATIEAWGLIDGQPTSKHLSILVYDDIITHETARSVNEMLKASEAFKMSLNLGNAKNLIFRIIGTRYHFNDPYSEIMKNKTAVPRIHKITKNGEVDGDPVLLSREQVAQKYRDMGANIFATQMLLDPRHDSVQGFNRDDIQWHEYDDGGGFNIYFYVDPANTKHKKSDYTAIWVIGYGEDKNAYVLDIVRDRLSLGERSEILFELHRKWSPIGVIYEEYGMQADISFHQETMKRERYRFTITPVAGRLSKSDRIRRLEKDFSARTIYLPVSVMRKCYDGKIYNLVDSFIFEEFVNFPFSEHDDLLDALSRKYDHTIRYPTRANRAPVDRYSRNQNDKKGSAWTS